MISDREGERTAEGREQIAQARRRVLIQVEAHKGFLPDSAELRASTGLPPEPTTKVGPPVVAADRR